MQTPQANVWKDAHWGLTWAIDDAHETRLIAHGGGRMGQISQLTCAPEHDFAVAVFTNANEGALVTKEVTRAALKAYLGIEITDPKPMEVEEEDLRQYVGSYTRPFSDVHLGILGGRLIGQIIYKMGFPAKDSPPPPPPPPFSVGLCEEDPLIILDGLSKSNTADIIRNADGSVGWVRFGRIHKKQT